MNFSRRTFFQAFVACLLPVLTLSCFISAQTRSGSRSTRVLFIGNSYTFFNELPEIFAKLAEAGNQGKVEIRMVAPGGWRLKDHWEKGDALKVLHDGKWDYVVLQDQSMLGVNYYLEGVPHVSSDEVFKPYAEKWAAAIRRAGATPVFYLTWARKAAPEDQAALNYAYIHAAKESKAVVAPVGIAWGWVREKQPAIELFYKDGSHPSPAGSYLAACTFYAAIFGKNPGGLPAKVGGAPVSRKKEEAGPEKTAVLVDLPPDQAHLLQSAAGAAWQELQRNGGYLNVSPVSPPTVAPLPAGEPLSTRESTGTWSGNMLFYPVGPVEMVLRLQLDGENSKGHLELKYHSKDFADESFDLADLRIGDRDLTFSDPQSVGVNNLKVYFHGASTRTDELRGTAETSVERGGSPIRLLGTWQLHRKHQ